MKNSIVMAGRGGPRIPRPRNVPPFLQHIKKAIDPIVELFNKGIGVDSSTVIFEPLADRRLKAHLNPRFVASLAPTAPGPSVTFAEYVAGSGYTAGDILTAVGGTSTTAFTLTIDAVDGSGIPTAWHWSGGYTYSVEPTNPVSFDGGTGIGAMFNLTWAI